MKRGTVVRAAAVEFSFLYNPWTEQKIILKIEKKILCRCKFNKFNEV